MGAENSPPPSGQSRVKEIESTKKQATKRKTNYWVEKVNEECRTLGVGKNITDMDAKTLNTVLTSYILSMRRIDGSDYEVSSVHNMFSSIARYLKENNSGADLENDPAFTSSREAKTAKVKKLKAAGKGNRPQRAMPISMAEEEKMWSSGQLGDHEPMVLTRAVEYVL